MAKYARIAGSGAYIPTEEHSNEEFRRKFGEEIINKSEEATGILTRFRAPADWATSDLAVEACRAAMADAGVQPGDIDLIVLGTDTPDYITPATSVVVQHKLGAKNAGTFDVGCACASFPTGLSIASGMMSNQPNIKRALVIGVYMMQRLADLDNDPMSFYYGDGAGAVVLEVSDKPGFISSALAADGSYYECWGIYSSGTKEPPSEESLKAGRTQVRGGHQRIARLGRCREGDARGAAVRAGALECGLHGNSWPTGIGGGWARHSRDSNRGPETRPQSGPEMQRTRVTGSTRARVEAAGALSIQRRRPDPGCGLDAGTARLPDAGAPACTARAVAAGRYSVAIFSSTRNPFACGWSGGLLARPGRWARQ